MFTLRQLKNQLKYQKSFLSWSCQQKSLHKLCRHHSWSTTIHNYFPAQQKLHMQDLISVLKVKNISLPTSAAVANPVLWPDAWVWQYRIALPCWWKKFIHAKDVLVICWIVTWVNGMVNNYMWCRTTSMWCSEHHTIMREEYNSMQCCGMV